ncbi:hypothetical protein [Pyxidicoccus sp. MSG2]|uniref:hypothetical protein n=1 Tax=Pyxidicoccus sp. MSG2 TaxID=2996790 RepID=UPI0022707F50|nr:hypothetical protein [Pyxidicoccus sp. MSG2]MCY1019585.1 hypothetical protein [Pyxidicoccus sp. MSG2]
MRAISSSAGSSAASHAQRSFATRQGNQANRIQKGIADGSLTSEEASSLKAKQSQIAEAKDRAMADGKIDKKERKELRKMQREASRDIFEQRHNGAEGPVAPEQRGSNIEGHQTGQRNRIQKGIGDGSLSAGEAGSLMEQQTRVAEAKGKAMADGTMDETEYNQLRQLQREASMAIFNARHNDGIRV